MRICLQAVLLHVAETRSKRLLEEAGVEAYEAIVVGGPGVKVGRGFCGRRGMVGVDAVVGG